MSCKEECHTINVLLFIILIFNINICRICLTGGEEVHNAVIHSIQDLATALSNYQYEVLVKMNEFIHILTLEQHHKLLVFYFLSTAQKTTKCNKNYLILLHFK